MVAIRRVKRLIQFSVLAVLLATLLLFLQWNEISDSEEFIPVKRGTKNQFETLNLRVTEFCRFIATVVDSNDISPAYRDLRQRVRCYLRIFFSFLYF